MDLEQLSQTELREVSTFFHKHFGKDEPDPEDVLKLAKDETSPIHDLFEWDDKKAANKYRLIQAKVLIKVIVIDQAPKKEPTYHYMKLTSDSGLSYSHSPEEPMESIYEQMIPSGISELRQFKQRYKAVEAFTKVIAVIEEIEKEYQDVESEESTAIKSA